MIEAIFWFCVFAATYSYFWYPALLAILPPRRSEANAPAMPVQKVAVIIAARNEAAKIAEKLTNTLALERPDVELDLMVASDASDDATDDIVCSHAEKGIRLVRSPVRKGKEHA